MATQAQLGKAAKAVLTPFMESNGFKKGRDAFYYRITEDGVIQILDVATVRGTHGRVWVTCTVPELLKVQRLNGEIRPGDCSILCGGMLGEDGIESGPDFFPSIADEQLRNRFMSSLPPYIERDVFPFFKRLSTRHALWEELAANGEPEAMRDLVIKDPSAAV
jgi:hypothetical protein